MSETTKNAACFLTACIIVDLENTQSEKQWEDALEHGLVCCANVLANIAVYLDKDDAGEVFLDGLDEYFLPSVNSAVEALRVVRAELRKTKLDHTRFH